jgi:hypothetical protein
MVGRPIDLFSAQPNNQWLLDSKIPGSKSGVLSLFNWAANELLTLRINPAQIIQSNKKVLVYDFWNDLFMGETDGDMEIPVPPRDVRSLCIVETAGVPQVLEVSDYLPQTRFSLSEVAWSGETSTLHGQSAGPSGDSYHIVLHVPAGYTPDRATVDGRESPLVKQPKNLWVLPLTGQGKPVEWSVHFVNTQHPRCNRDIRLLRGDRVARLSLDFQGRKSSQACLARAGSDTHIIESGLPSIRLYIGEECKSPSSEYCRGLSR